MRVTVPIFVILVDGHFQTCRGQFDAAFEVRDNFNEMFRQHGHKSVASVVRGTVTFDPSKLVSETEGD